MFSLVYVSTALRLMQPAQMHGLLRASRKRNAQAGVTGVLLYSGGTFMQALEGEEAVVRALYERIARDPRHTDPTVLVAETTTARQFGFWRMGYYGCSTDLVNGFADWQSITHPVREGIGGRARTLVRSFGVLPLMTGCPAMYG